MKPKLTTERRIEIMREANRLLDRCIFLLDEAYEAHLIAAGMTDAEAQRRLSSMG